MTWRQRRRWARRALSILIVVAATAIAYADGGIEIIGDLHDLTVATQVRVMGNGRITAAYIASPLPIGSFGLFPVLSGDNCAPDQLSCLYPGRPPLDLGEQPIGVQCLYTGAGSANAVLRVEGLNPAVDFDEDPITCMGAGPSDAFTVSPLTVTVADVAVGSTSPPGPKFTVTNLLDTAYQISIDVFSPEWRISGCESPCTLDPLGAKELGVSLTPQGLGARDTMVMLAGGVPGTMSSRVVLLKGNGVMGGESLDVIVPAGPIFNIDMGPVPLSGGTRTLRLRYTGPSTTQTASILSSDTERVSVGMDVFATPVGNTDITVTCKAPIPDEVFETLFITSAPTVPQNTMSVNVLCSVTNVSVELEPNELDFGDVPKDADSVELTLMVRNTGTATVMLDNFQIVSASPLSTLTLDTPPVGDLIPDATAMVKVRMTPSAAEDYAATTKLTFEVDGVTLEVPIEGRVTVKSARIDPTGALDLGTACIGRPLTGTIRLTNDGTAPFEVMAPTIEGPFSGTYVPDVSFPAEIPEGETQSVQITTTQTSGSLEGTFNWVAETETYTLDLRAEYIADGTAVSPRALDFAEIDVDATTAPRTITLENCDSVPTTLSIQSVIPRQGPARAWRVEPAMETTTLDPGERYTVTVRFAPVTPGQHLAELPFLVDGGQTTVMLSGFADGELLERTSFYACTCNGGGSLASGWPLVGALGWLIRRRRRR